MARLPKNSASLSFVAQSGAEAHGFEFLHSPQNGVWALAQDFEANSGGIGEADSQISSHLLATLEEQVGAGEDLTAALLVAHGRAQREFSSTDTNYAARLSRIIAMRLNASSASFEIAWVGDMQAYLVRKGEVLRLNPVTGNARASGKPRTNTYQMTSTRVDGLGGRDRVRPIIDRKLGHAQSGDMLVLGCCGMPDAIIHESLAQNLKGVWSLDYKVQKLNSALNGQLDGSARAAVVPMLIWRGK